MRPRLFAFSWGMVLSSLLTARAQIDPFKRELIQMGYSQPLQGQGPISAYAFYYLNYPDFFRTNITLRLAVAPLYLDSEVGFGKALGRETDFAVGVAGGGFGDTYSEVRGGKYHKEESFTGHGGGASASIYHRFNPQQEIPLTGILRSEVHYSTYSRDGDTAPGFVLPEDRANLYVRTGFRWGGREPLLLPSLAMEVSGWYEGQFRSQSGSYGFANDREVKPNSHLFWARGLLAYTTPEWKHNFNVSLTVGTSVSSDRFSSYRLGDILPLASEFPLALPGYYYQEISARRFVLLGGNYSIPLDSRQRWSFNLLAATAGVQYVPGLGQPGQWHSGLGGGLIYRSPSDAWQLALGYAYGVDAIRSNGRGAHSLGLLLQFDLERAHVPLFDRGVNPSWSRGLQHIFRSGSF